MYEGYGNRMLAFLLTQQAVDWDGLLLYRRLRSLSTGAYRSNSGDTGAKKRAGAY